MVDEPPKKRAISEPTKHVPVVKIGEIDKIIGPNLRFELIIWFKSSNAMFFQQELRGHFSKNRGTVPQNGW